MKYISSRDLFLIDLLQDFLKISFPFRIKESEISDNEKKAAILFQSFLELNEQSVLDIHPSLRVYASTLGKISPEIGTKHGKKQAEFVELKSVTLANTMPVENPYQNDFDTVSNHVVIDIQTPKIAFHEQTREILCKRTGANEYTYEHGSAHRVSNFTHNIGKILNTFINEGRLDVIIQLDRPLRKNEKAILISKCKYTGMYPSKHEYHFTTKHFNGPESGSYTIIFPVNKPPVIYKASIVVRDNHLRPKSTINPINKITTKDGRIELSVIIDAYELNLGDKISISWDW